MRPRRRQLSRSNSPSLARACSRSARRWAGARDFRISDLVLACRNAARALGILSLITFLIGLILAFVGAVQLRPFRASIFGANLVAVAVTREIGGS